MVLCTRMAVDRAYVHIMATWCQFFIFIHIYSGISDPKCSLPRNRTPSVLRVIQNPFGKVIFVKKAPWTLSTLGKKNLNGQITVLSIFRLFYFFQRTKFCSTDIFFQNVFWQNSRQEHNLKLTPQGFCITRHIDGVVAFGAIPIWWFSGHLTQISTQDFVVLTGEIFFGRVLGHGRALVGQKWPVLGRYFQTKMESELYWRC